MSGPVSYAKQIALDLIAQMQAEGAPEWVLPQFSAEYQRMYLSALETMAPAGGPTSQMQIVFAPVEPKYERIGWGAVRIMVSLGVLFDVLVQKQNGVITDPNIDAYEFLVDQFCTWLMGPRKFAGGWCASDPVAILGDHYNDHLWEKSEFHVPVLIDFFLDTTAD